MTIQNTETIFNILGRGGFISQNSTDADRSRLYDDIEENEEEYRAYFKGIGFMLEGGNGYYYFTRKEPKINVQEKVERLAEWIDILDFLTTFDPIFTSGYEFRPADIEARLSTDIELKGKAEQLIAKGQTFHEFTEKLIDRMKSFGVIETANELESTYRVTAAFRYIEELVNALKIAEEVKDEIPE